MDRLEYEKMRRRYLSPKSPFSERGLALASLNIFNVLPITNVHVSLSIFMDRYEYEKMRQRYLSPKSPFSERGLAFASLNSSMFYRLLMFMSHSQYSWIGLNMKR